MAKNEKLINSLMEVARRNQNINIENAARRDTPQIYAAVAISLFRLLDMPEEEKTKAINDVFVESQEVWDTCLSEGVDIQQRCLDETGIDVRGDS